MVGALGSLARASGPAFVPDGQHLALPQLQGAQPHGTAIATHCHLFRSADLSDLELLAAGFARDLAALCHHRNRDSCRRNHSPPFPAPPAAAAAGAPGRLTCILIAAPRVPLSPSSAEEPCSARKVASCWREAVWR